MKIAYLTTIEGAYGTIPQDVYIKEEDAKKACEEYDNYLYSLSYEEIDLY